MIDSGPQIATQSFWSSRSNLTGRAALELTASRHRHHSELNDKEHLLIVKDYMKLILALIAIVFLPFSATAQISETTPDFSGKSPADFADESTMKEVATGGVPMGRWKEGLLFEGISPQPWLKSAANWFPGTEEVQPQEMRITFMGTAPMLRPGQMNTSIYVELGNGDTFIFDMGEGAVAN
jgi:hypothetical protein